MTSMLLIFFLSLSSYAMSLDTEMTKPLDLETECNYEINDPGYCQTLVSIVYTYYYFTVLLAYDRKEDFKPHQFFFLDLEYALTSRKFNAFSYIALPLYPLPGNRNSKTVEFMPGILVPVLSKSASSNVIDEAKTRLTDMLRNDGGKLKLFGIPAAIQRKVNNDLAAANIFDELATAGATDCFLISDFLIKVPTLIIRDTAKKQGYRVQQLLTNEEVAPYLLNCINLNYY